jgi:hypothetical protein
MDELAFEQVIRSFANECGGRLLLSIQTEKRALAAGESVHTAPERFGATKQIFIDAGKSETAHQLWRQSELRPLCERFLLHLINKLNPHFFLTDEDIELKSIQRIKEPEITREQLEIDVAQWYLREESLNGFEYPGSEQNELKKLFPKSVLYHVWQHSAAPNQDKSDSSAEAKVCISASQERLPHTTNETREGNLRHITISDLEGKELTAKEVVSLLMAKKPELFAEAPDKCEEDWIKNLRDEASRASSKHKEGEKLDPPIRIQKGRGKWSGIALVQKAQSRSNGNKFRIIKDNANTKE